MGDRKVPTFKAWAEKDWPFCGRTKLAINQKTDEGKDTWSMIPDLEKLCQFYHLATNLSHKLFMIQMIIFQSQRCDSYPGLLTDYF